MASSFSVDPSIPEGSAISPAFLNPKNRIEQEERRNGGRKKSISQQKLTMLEPKPFCFPPFLRSSCSILLFPVNSSLRVAFHLFRAVIALLFLLAGPLAAESVDRVVLPSGLTIIIAEQHTTQAVTIRVAVRASPLNEGERLGSGLSLLTQRLVASSGAGMLSASQTRDAFARLGDLGTSVTAMTRSEFSLTTTATNLTSALTLLANRLATPSFASDDLERERSAVALMESPIAHAALFALLFRQHPARLPIAGLTSLRNALTLEQVQSYHLARYRSANTIVVVCGNVAAVDARKQVELAFAAYPLGGYATQLIPLEPPPVAPRYQSLISTTVKQPYITIAWRTESLDHAMQPGLAVLATWLGGEHGIVNSLLGSKGLAQDIVVENIAPSIVPGYLRISFSTTSERRAEAEQVLYKGLDALAHNPLNENHLAAARATTLRQIAQRQSTVLGLCDELLAWELAAGDPTYIRRFTEQVAAVGGIEVMRVLRRYMVSRDGDRSRCTVVLRPLDPNAARPLDSSKPPTPVSVVAPEVIELAHGVRLLLRPSLEQPLARVHVVLGGGAAVEDQFQRGATSLLAPLMCRATETRSPSDIQTLLLNHGMQLTTSADLHRLDLGISCFSSDVPEAFKLLIDCLSKAALPLDELELIRQRTTANLANEGWERRFLTEVRSVALAGHYAANDPRSGKYGLAHLDRGVVLAHYRRLAVGANTVIAVYGRFDRDAVINQAKALITARLELATGTQMQPVGSPWSERAQPSLTVTSHDATVAGMALVWHGPALADRARDEAPMLVLSALLESRLQRSLIGNHGITQLQAVGEAYDQRGIWMVWGACDETQLDHAQQSVRDEVARFFAQLWLPEADRGALLDGELIAAKASCAVRWALEQENLDHVAGQHASHLLLRQDIALDLTMPERLGSITRKDLLRVAQAWLAGDPLTVIAKPKTAVVVPAPVPTTTPLNTTPVIPPSVDPTPEQAPLKPSSTTKSSAPSLTLPISSRAEFTAPTPQAK